MCYLDSLWSCIYKYEDILTVFVVQNKVYFYFYLMLVKKLNAFKLFILLINYWFHLSWQCWYILLLLFKIGDLFSFCGKYISTHSSSISSCVTFSPNVSTPRCPMSCHNCLYFLKKTFILQYSKQGLWLLQQLTCAGLDRDVGFWNDAYQSKTEVCEKSIRK